MKDIKDNSENKKRDLKIQKNLKLSKINKK